MNLHKFTELMTSPSDGSVSIRNNKPVEEEIYINVDNIFAIKEVKNKHIIIFSSGYNTLITIDSWNRYIEKYHPQFLEKNKEDLF